MPSAPHFQSIYLKYILWNETSSPTERHKVVRSTVNDSERNCLSISWSNAQIVGIQSNQSSRPIRLTATAALAGVLGFVFDRGSYQEYLKKYCPNHIGQSNWTIPPKRPIKSINSGWKRRGELGVGLLRPRILPGIPERLGQICGRGPRQAGRRSFRRDQRRDTPQRAGTVWYGNGCCCFCYHCCCRATDVARCCTLKTQCDDDVRVLWFVFDWLGYV